MVPRIILTGDRSLETTYRGNNFTGYLTSLPLGPIPKGAYNWFYPKPPIGMNNSLDFPHLSLRTIESILFHYYKENMDIKTKEIKIIHPDMLEKEIKDNDLVLISTMDPLGLGPATSSWQILPFGTPYHVWHFWNLLKRLQRLKKKINFKIMVGGAGVWQIRHKSFLNWAGIDYIFEGEAECNLGHEVESIFSSELSSDFSSKSSKKEHNSLLKGKICTPNEIRPLLGPTNLYMVEISRGCGRMCQFCAPTQSGKIRFVPKNTILTTAKNFMKKNVFRLNLQSEDTLRYGSKNFEVNSDSLLGLYRDLFDLGIKRIYMTHATFSDIVSAPDTIHKLASMLREHGHKYYGLQPGIESGSERLMRKLMGGKFLPLKNWDWQDIVEEGIKICHREKWVPTASVVLGFPGETEEDLKETEFLIDKLIAKNYRFIFAPLIFVPVPTTPLGNWSRPEIQKMTKLQQRIFNKMWKYTLKWMPYVWNVYNVEDYTFPTYKIKALSRITNIVSRFY